MTAFHEKTPAEIAEEWYSYSSISNGLQSSNPTAVCNPPTDIHSPQFARWLTNQYRLAMAKGIQLGRENG